MAVSPPPYLDDPKWFIQDNMRSNWTSKENKLFENAIALYDNDTPDRWQKIAVMIPGKTIIDVTRHYKELEDDVRDIEAGMMPLPSYGSSSFGLEWLKNPDRRMGIPWTEDEHRLFLMGLKKYGSGNWRNISRNFVVSRSPTQVARYAQECLLKSLSSGSKDGRRSSTPDVNLTDGKPPLAKPNLDVVHNGSTQPNEGTRVIGFTIIVLLLVLFFVGMYEVGSQFFDCRIYLQGFRNLS